MNFTKIMQSIGFVTALIGVAGLIGVIEFGTGCMQSVLLFIGGALILCVFHKEEKEKWIIDVRKKENAFIVMPRESVWRCRIHILINRVRSERRKASVRKSSKGRP